MANEKSNEAPGSSAPDPSPQQDAFEHFSPEDYAGEQLDAEQAGRRDQAHARHEAADSEEPSIESLQRQLTVAEKRVLQAEAEKENFRKRIKSDYEAQLRFATLPLLQDILQVRDNLQRALDSAGGHENSAGLREGVALVAKQLDDQLAKHHCHPIPAVGERFDPNFHEAIQQAPSDEFPAGVISMEVTGGYQLHQRVVRPSQVIVSTGPVQST